MCVWQSVTLAEATVLQANAQLVSAETVKKCKISLRGVLNPIGIKIVVSVLYLMKVEEMLMLPIITVMDLPILDFGKLTTLTGVDVIMDMLHATQIKI